MAMGIAFLGVAMMFLLISISTYSKAQKAPRDTEANIKEYKKLSSVGVSFLFTGITFAILAMMWLFIL